MVDPPAPPVQLAFTDIRPLVRAQLAALRIALRSRLARTTEPVTRAHLQDAGARIGEILEPK